MYVCLGLLLPNFNFPWVLLQYWFVLFCFIPDYFVFFEEFTLSKKLLKSPIHTPL